MTALPFSLDKLQICDPDKSRSTCHIFINHGTPAEERSLGKLFLLAEISSQDKINADIINDIQEELKSSYYHTDDLNIETAFEKSLEAVNQKIADMVGDYDTNWLDKFSAVACVFRDEVIHLSYIGQINSFLVRRGQIIDILQSTGDDVTAASKVNPLKAFSNIISGNLVENDALLFCLPSLLDYLSQEKLKRTITEQPASQAIRYLENLLAENASHASFAALILKMSPAASQSPAFASSAPLSHQSGQFIPAMGAGNTQSSMADLLEKQTSTDKILSPSLTGYFWASIRRTGQKFFDFVRLTIFKQSPRRIRFQREMKDYRPATPLPSLKKDRPISGLLDSSVAQAKKTFAATGRGLAAVFSRLKRQPSNLPDSQTLITGNISSQEKINRLIIKFKRLPRVSKILLAFTIVVAFFLAQSIFSSGLTKQKNTEQVDYATTVTQISNDIQKAEAALSYSNEDGAKKLLNEAQNLINSLPAKNKEQKAKIQELQNSLNAQLERTKHIVDIASPVAVADLSATDKSADGREMVLANKNLYIFSPANKNIYSLAPDGGTAKAWPLSNTTQYVITQNDKSLLLLNTANNLDEFTLATGKVAALEFAFSTADLNITAIAFYESKIYFLDIKNNQVYRASKTSAGYSSPAAWIKDDSDIRQAVSLAVDGNVYIAMKNGQVLKFFQGNRQNWALADISPALSKIDKIWASTASQYIYLLDIQGKRIVEFNKDGQLLNQYTSAAFTNLRDFVVDPANKKIYALNDNSVLAFGLNP